MNNILYNSISSVKGIGPKTLEILAELNIFTIKDVIFNIPYRVSLSNEFSLNVKNGEKVIVRGKVENSVNTSFYGKNKNRSFFSLLTNIGSIKIIFFNQLYLKQHIVEGKELVIKGVYNSSNNTITASSISFSNNILENDNSYEKTEVVYHLKKGITNKQYIKIVQKCFDLVKKENCLIDLVPKDFKGIWSLYKILYTLHFPESSISFDKAKKMFAFHELLEYQLKLQLKNLKNKEENKESSIKISSKDIETFKKSLSFKLTNSQNLVIEEIVDDLKSFYQMDRLLQGDVGCGKTVVAAALIYGVARAGFQSAIMVPTEILAIQHFETFFNFFKDLDISVALLTSSTPSKERKKIINLLKEGSIDLLVGTHSLIQDDIIFKNLKFSITDEQHRFGVNQRRSLCEKGENINTLMMTATPIPRSLAITLITDIKVSTINELPSGRKKVHTTKATSKNIYSVFDNIISELKLGRQGYVVCPLIEESEKIDLKNVEEIYEKLNSYLTNDYKIAILHGKMKSKEKDKIIEKFLNKEIHILISTTVIEVGVNVPNATFMVIVDANRFGLATLHQLRGRVGRSDYQSYCILISDVKSERVDIMCLENDGFKIAEFDLKMRGPGDFFGTKQSGLPSFKVADLINDTELMYLAKKLATKLIDVTDNKDKLINYIGLHKTIS